MAEEALTLTLTLTLTLALALALTLTLTLALALNLILTLTRSSPSGWERWPRKDSVPGGSGLWTSRLGSSTRGGGGLGGSAPGGSEIKRDPCEIDVAHEMGVAVDMPTGFQIPSPQLPLKCRPSAPVAER